MSIDKKQFIHHYAKRACDGETSLFLGAGVSASAGYPSWMHLLKPCAKELGIEIDDKVDLYLLAQYYANRFSYSALKKIINENVNLLKYESTLIDELLNLNFRTIWTTNYDTVLENNLFKRNVLTNTVNNDRDLSNIIGNNRVNIYKLNGDIKNLDNIVITQKDIEQYEPSHELLLTFFKRELVTNTFLFLGYSFTDTIVLNCLNAINRCLKESTTCHYAIMLRGKIPDFDYFVNDLEQRYHVNVLVIDEYEELPNILKELNYEIKRKNIFFSGVFDKLPSDEDVFANDLCGKIAEALLKDNFAIYTGYGRNFGNYLAGNSLQYILYHNMNVNKHLIMRPFLKNMSFEDKSTHRKMLINDCHVSIFMFGQVPTENGYENSKGMIDEYEIAKEQRRIIIPIGSTGYTSFEIWKDVKKNIILYPYLERYIDSLNSKDIEIIVNTIVQILSEVC
ncbi:SIR2 family protein [Clostridium aminobutyricum]|uniref:SIR2 family protein n=1 Tax=Clostridium aminobutyricum TaxID=33953 RepID=A0A939DB67_CLOAM|nr:SIR2 family protein [Clostridium aminobutyricum]MBN7774631.1 SIR2 family protein [Clostridium aminobutyricum]